MLAAGGSKRDARCSSCCCVSVFMSESNVEWDLERMVAVKSFPAAVITSVAVVDGIL